jgi:hypothetical protein
MLGIMVSHFGVTTTVTRVFMIFLNHSRKVSELYLKLGQDHFLQYSFQYIITHSLDAMQIGNLRSWQRR